MLLTVLKWQLPLIMLLPSGACLPLLVTLLSWRLALLIPARKFGLEKRRHSNTKNYPLKETDSMQYFSAAGLKSVTYSTMHTTKETLMLE